MNRGMGVRLRAGRTAGLLLGVVVGGVVLAPVLGRGYALSYDMVFVPRPPITIAKARRRQIVRSVVGAR